MHAQRIVLAGGEQGQSADGQTEQDDDGELTLIFRELFDHRGPPPLSRSNPKDVT